MYIGIKRLIVINIPSLTTEVKDSEGPEILFSKRTVVVEKDFPKVKTKRDEKLNQCSDEVDKW